MNSTNGLIGLHIIHCVQVACYEIYRSPLKRLVCVCSSQAWKMGDALSHTLSASQLPVITLPADRVHVGIIRNYRYVPCTLTRVDSTRIERVIKLSGSRDVLKNHAPV